LWRIAIYLIEFSAGAKKNTLDAQYDESVDQWCVAPHYTMKTMFVYSRRKYLFQWNTSI